jgi:acyl dehydratase
VRYWEDFAVGQRYELGSKTVTETEIIAFAREFDPQPMHVDPDAAGRSMFGGLVASGLHTSSIFMRLFVDGLVRDSSNSAGLRLDIVLRGPVRPGDTLSASATVSELRASRSRPDQGLLTMLFELRNQSDEVVWQATGLSMMGRRPPTATT